MKLPGTTISDIQMIGICGQAGSGRQSLAKGIAIQCCRNSWIDSESNEDAGLLHRYAYRMHLNMRLSESIWKIASEITGISIIPWRSRANDHQTMLIGHADLERLRDIIKSNCLDGPEFGALVGSKVDSTGCLDISQRKLYSFIHATIEALIAEPKITYGQLLKIIEDRFRSLADSYWFVALVKKWKGEGKVIISDIRSATEADLVRRYGVLIEIRRPQLSGFLLPDDNTIFIALRPQIIIWNNGTEKQLQDTVEAILKIEIADLKIGQPIEIWANPV